MQGGVHFVLLRLSSQRVREMYAYRLQNRKYYHLIKYVKLLVVWTLRCMPMVITKLTNESLATFSYAPHHFLLQLIASLVYNSIYIFVQNFQNTLHAIAVFYCR